MFIKRGGLILFILLMLALADFFMVLNRSVTVDFFYVLIKNILIPLFVAPSLLQQTNLAVFKSPRLNWMVAGAITGAIPTAGMIIASGVDYFHQGGMQKLDGLNGINVPLTSGTVAQLLFALLMVWLFLAVLSAFSGLASSFLFAKNPAKEK